LDGGQDRSPNPEDLHGQDNAERYQAAPTYPSVRALYSPKRGPGAIATLYPYPSTAVDLSQMPWAETSAEYAKDRQMKRRWRDLAWLLLVLAIVGFGVRHLSVSHELDGQTYNARIFGYANAILELKNGSFHYKKSGCTGSTEWSGTYRVDGPRVTLFPVFGAKMQYELRESGGRTYLQDSSGKDFDRTLRLIADGQGGPHPPRWQGGPLRINGLYPGMALSSLGSNFRPAGRIKNYEIFCNADNTQAVSVKGTHVMAVGGTQVSEVNGNVLLEIGEDNNWVEECLGQKSSKVESLTTFPCGLTQGHGLDFFGSYFLGEVSEIRFLEDAMFIQHHSATN